MLKISSILIAISISAVNHGLAKTPPPKELPLWEAGVGILPMRNDHYRGSPQNKWFLLPFPAYSVRGKNVEAENGLIRGHIARFDNFTLDLSFSFGLPVSSAGDKLRKGMDSLDPTFEMGPMIRYYLWKSEDKNHFINLEMPYRAVFATDLSYLEHVGYFSVPYVNFLNRPTPSTFGWSTEFAFGIQYGSKGFHDRFYSVNQKDVTANRKYYHANGGYSGTTATIVVSKRIDNFLFIPYLRYDYLDGAVYNSSPLYKNQHYTFFGFTAVWFFASSKEVQKAPTMVR